MKDWFNYMVMIDEASIMSQKLTKSVSDMALSHISMDSDKVERCVNASFDEPGNYLSDNKYLREDRKW